MPIAADVLKCFVNPVFVETGTFRGGGIMTALSVGFERAYSADIDTRATRATRRICDQEGLSNVELFTKPSPLFLGEVIPQITEPITFWLDAHPGGYDLNPDNCPVWDELKVISKLCQVPYTILIDDMRCFKPVNYAKLLDAVNEIFISTDPDWRVHCVDGTENRARDILLICRTADIPEGCTYYDAQRPQAPV